MPLPTLTRATPLRTRPALAPYVALAAYLAIALPFVPRTLRTPSHVARVVVSNPTAYDVSVAVVDADGGRIPLGSLGPRHTARFLEVADVGERWTLVYGSRGSEEQEVVTREALERDGWRVRVPTALGARLELAGESPTPD